MSHYETLSPQRRAEYDAYVAQCVAALGKPTPQQIRKLQIIFDEPVTAGRRKRRAPAARLP